MNTYTTNRGTVLTEDEYLYMRNDAALRGAFGEVDYDAEQEQSYWESQVMANPDGNTTGEHVPSTVDGTSITATCPRWVDQNQYNDSQSLYLRGPGNRPQGAVTLGTIGEDGTVWERTVLPSHTHRGYDGTAETRSRVNGKRAAETHRKGHRTMTSAERKAVHDQRERERKARANGEDVATIERERAAWLAKRAKRSGKDSAAVVATALAEGSASWGGGNTATVAE